MMKRRHFLLGAAALGTLPALGLARSKVANRVDSRAVEQMRNTWREFLPSDLELVNASDAVERADEEWRALLGDQAYHILFEEGTERPFSSALNGEKRRGLFVCAACDLPLFTSEMKYDSGTGWPSFFTHIPDHFATKTDFKMIWPRTEYHCVRCGGHHGHVFPDGPEPTGERWCNNGLALRFIPSEA